MKTIGIIAEYNPFHNGHLHHINEIKKLYPDSLIILVLNGYFMQRGEISILSKEEKVKIALNYHIDLVLELPFVWGTQSADNFAQASIEILNACQTDYLIFGSECNNIELLTKIAEKQLTDADFNKALKDLLATGLNYPTALNKALQTDINTPNDLLGIAYVKAILKTNSKMIPLTIKRTNNYHDTKSNNEIISASNIRLKLNNNDEISTYTPVKIKPINDQLMFPLLKYKILTDTKLNIYLTVDEGIENKLKKAINSSHSINDLIMQVKSKRFTYNKIHRLLIHLLIGFTKEERKVLNGVEYLKVLGFNAKGQKYLKSIKKDLSIPLFNKKMINTITYQTELKASHLYDLILNTVTSNWELSNKPINKD